MKSSALFCWLLGLVLLVGCGPKAKSQPITIPVNQDSFIEINPDLKVRHIQEGAFEFVHTFPWEANSLAVLVGDHLYSQAVQTWWRIRTSRCCAPSRMRWWP